MRITFNITGTQLDGSANPIPKQRLTLRQSWTPAAQRYERWKRWVRTAFVTGGRILDAKPGDEARAFFMAAQREAALDRKPFDTKVHPARMTVVFAWRDERHPDPENAFGAIADALFQDDRHLAGAFEFEHGDKGGARVLLEIGPGTAKRPLPDWT